MITKAIRDIERWIAEARVASNASAGAFYWEPDTNGSTEDSQLDPKERWALERFCEYLLEKGALVPLSRKSVNGILFFNLRLSQLMRN